MSDVGCARWRRATESLLAVALLSTVLFACGRAGDVQVGTAFPAFATPVPVPPAATSSFQGAVTAFDPDAGQLTVAVQIVWTPVIKADRHERQVLVDPGTRWEPSTDVMIGDEVQVEAADPVDGLWPAVRVQLLDID